MRKFFVLPLFLISANLFAQECIPNPENTSKDIISCLRQKDKKCITDKMISWTTVERLYDSTIAKNKDNKEFIDHLPVKDSIKADYDSKAYADMVANIDSLSARGERIGVKWSDVIFVKEQSNITRQNEMPSQSWLNDAKVKFKFGDSTYTIAYEAMLSNGKWEIVELKTNFEISSKTGQPLGLMSDTYHDYSKQSKTEANSPEATTGKAPVKKSPSNLKKPVKKQAGKK